MPHILLETTADLAENANIPDVLESLTLALASCESIQPKSIKAYHSLRSVWTMGEGAPPGFAHVTVSILAGRPEDLRRTIADRLYAVLVQAFAESAEAGEVSLTLDVHEMDPATYRK